MGRQIVILNGSPRKNGNTTALVKAFTRGATEAGNDVSDFFLSGMNISGCKGCFGGRSGLEYPCTQKDDMSEIYLSVKKCDILVLASPLYYWTISGQLKAVIDRLFALEEGEENLLRGHGKACALLMAAEGYAFEDALLYYNHLVKHLRWRSLGEVLAGGNCDVGDIQGKIELQKAFELGRSICDISIQSDNAQA